MMFYILAYRLSGSPFGVACAYLKVGSEEHQHIACFENEAAAQHAVDTLNAEKISRNITYVITSTPPEHVSHSLQAV